MSAQFRGYREWSTVIAEDVASKFSNQIIKSKIIIAIGFLVVTILIYTNYLHT